MDRIFSITGAYGGWWFKKKKRVGNYVDEIQKQMFKQLIVETDIIFLKFLVLSPYLKFWYGDYHLDIYHSLLHIKYLSP